MSTTCNNINNSTIYKPDNCGKLTVTKYIQNWSVVKMILEWIKGFFTFEIEVGRELEAHFTQESVSTIDLQTLTGDFLNHYDGGNGLFSSNYRDWALYVNGVRYYGNEADTHDFYWVFIISGVVTGIAFKDRDTDLAYTITDESTFILEMKRRESAGDYFCVTAEEETENNCGC